MLFYGKGQHIKIKELVEEVSHFLDTNDLEEIITGGYFISPVIISNGMYKLGAFEIFWKLEKLPKNFVGVVIYPYEATEEEVADFLNQW